MSDSKNESRRGEKKTQKKKKKNGGSVIDLKSNNLGICLKCMVYTMIFFDKYGIYYDWAASKIFNWVSNHLHIQ